jgi:hypothetical protein
MIRNGEYICICDLVGETECDVKDWTETYVR